MTDWWRLCLHYEVPIRTAPPDAMSFMLVSGWNAIEGRSLLVFKDDEGDAPWRDTGGEG